MTGCEEGLSNDWLCCRVGTLILEITPFHGKYFAALLSLSVKSFTQLPGNQADLSECTTSELITYTESGMPLLTYFFVGPALDNAC